MDANDAAELLCLFKDGGSCSAAPSASLCVFKQTEPAVYSNTEFLESFHYWMFFVRLNVTVDPQVCSIRTHSVFVCLIQQEELLLSCVMDGGDRRWSGSTRDTISMTLVFNHMTSWLWLTRGVHVCLVFSLFCLIKCQVGLIGAFRQIWVSQSWWSRRVLQLKPPYT